MAGPASRGNGGGACGHEEQGRDTGDGDEFFRCFQPLPLHFSLFRHRELSMDWAAHYRPQRLQDIIGNGQAIRQIAEWGGQTWHTGARPLILYGKPGIGKTTAAHAFARDMHWDVIELNASDQRTKGGSSRELQVRAAPPQA
ncbi:AAA family ATPase [Methanogenium cariaci]|uniref:AAA family ATPase n=1 Tax=Methanogenium cariaci TaxID=2197 RepID=UPI000785B018|nr:AAA family ATPase [Methanogenium cariaci]